MRKNFPRNRPESCWLLVMLTKSPCIIQQWPRSRQSTPPTGLYSTRSSRKEAKDVHASTRQAVCFLVLLQRAHHASTGPDQACSLAAAAAASSRNQRLLLGPNCVPAEDPCSGTWSSRAELHS